MIEEIVLYKTKDGFTFNVRLGSLKFETNASSDAEAFVAFGEFIKVRHRKLKAKLLKEATRLRREEEFRELLFRKVSIL